ncbi:glycoside hydrolase family 16 protein [Kitasatospora mediocidica]|uniref:glycoside hydrolase family 16 protein n=1 Tax=Kitasatospora mediocidica TaxID=58352 RepID=UPI0012FC5AE4|nr:family 16 glycosylhydrolase [Kitasatospora mediocidica]
MTRHNVTICPSGFTYTSGARTFLAGTYSEFGYYKDSTGYHDLPQQTLTVAPPSGPPADPTQGKTLTWDEEFNQPIAYGTRWVGTTTSAYQYGTHNPNDDKLDWLAQSAVTVANGVATFTAQPSSHVLENGKQAWTTGLLTTEGSSEGFQVRTDDYIETRVQMPSGIGAWPALWSWRNGDNEIDKYEYHPDNPNLLELTNHVQASQDYYTNAAGVAPGDWVVIGTHYGATSVDWYVNGVKVFSDGTGVGASWSAYLILNLSVEAGTYHPGPQNSTPITSAADYVRVYR